MVKSLHCETKQYNGKVPIFELQFHSLLSSSPRHNWYFYPVGVKPIITRLRVKNCPLVILSPLVYFVLFGICVYICCVHMFICVRLDLYLIIVLLWNLYIFKYCHFQMVVVE